MNFSIPSLDRLVAGVDPKNPDQSRCGKNALQALLGTVTRVVRAANGIPSGEEYSIRTSSSESAAQLTHQAAAEALEVLGVAARLAVPDTPFSDAARRNLSAHRSLSGACTREAASGPDGRRQEAVQNLFPAFQDFLDDLLDDVDRAVAFHERSPNAPLPLLTKPKKSLKASTAGLSGKDARKNATRKDALFPEGHITALSLALPSRASGGAARQASSSWAALRNPQLVRELAAAVRNRPQRQWLHLIDNFSPRFVPRLPAKPHALAPLHPGICRAQRLRSRRLRRLRRLIDGEEDESDEEPDEKLETEATVCGAAADSFGASAEVKGDVQSSNTAQGDRAAAAKQAAEGCRAAPPPSQPSGASTPVALPPSLSLHLHGRGAFPLSGSGDAGACDSTGLSPSARMSSGDEETEPLPHVYEAELLALTWTGPNGEAVDGVYGGPDLFTVSKPRRWKPLKDTPLVRIAEKEELQELVDELSSGAHSLVAIDLEHHSFHSYRGFTCLLQLSTREKDYIIDPFALFDHLHVLNTITANPKILKIFHGADSDIIWLQRDFSVYVVNMFDTCVAARALAVPGGASLANLLQTYCQVEANKQYQLADWRRRPLTPEMETYARSDTHYLPFIFDVMKNQLLSKPELGAALSPSAVTDFDGTLEVTEAGKQTMMFTMERSRDVCLKLHVEAPFDAPAEAEVLLKRTRAGLSPLSYVVFIELLKWRDTLARRLDRSPVSLATPAHLLLLAQKRPTSAIEFAAAMRPAPPTLRQHMPELIQLIQRSLLDSEAAQRAASCSSLLSPLVAPEASHPPSDFFDEKKRKRRSRDEEDTSSGSDEDLLPKAVLLQRAAAQARHAARAADVSGDASPSVKKECYGQDQDESSPSPRSSSSDPQDSVGAVQKDAEDVKCRESTGTTQRGETPRFPERKRRRLIVAARDKEVHDSACQRRRLDAPQVSLTVVAPDAVDRAAYPDFLIQRRGLARGVSSGSPVHGDAVQRSSSDVCSRVYAELKLVERHHLLVSHDILNDPVACLLPSAASANSATHANSSRDVTAEPVSRVPFAGAADAEGDEGRAVAEAQVDSSDVSFFPLLCSLPVPPPPAALLRALADRSETDPGEEEGQKRLEERGEREAEREEAVAEGEVVVVAQQKWKRRNRRRGQSGRRGESKISGRVEKEPAENEREKGEGERNSDKVTPPASVQETSGRNAGVPSGKKADRTEIADLPLLAPEDVLPPATLTKKKDSCLRSRWTDAEKKESGSAARAASTSSPSSEAGVGETVVPERTSKDERDARKPSKRGAEERHTEAESDREAEDNGEDEEVLRWLPAAFLNKRLSAASLSAQARGKRNRLQEGKTAFRRGRRQRK
ncbi:UNVERIFIED_CONTAM: 3'-5' exonuclease domain-containing protein [Hammondia hammondi]|eukprot:XP_008883747.1 3'-5' exonuclease domain-containing protein [Hammondia hammondi]